MTEFYYSYESFMKFASTLDRNEHTLPEEAIKTLYTIKKKLNIKDITHLKYCERFEKPKIKKEGDILNDVYKCLNKITAKTYDKLSKDILSIIDTLSSEDEETNQMICKKFFEIITNNSLCCELYAKLYNEMCITHEEFKVLFKENIQKYMNEFKSFEYVSPNENYDEYCISVKKIDKMKNFTLFLSKSLSYLLCEINDIVDIILYFQKRCIDTIEDDVHIVENEQVVDTLFVLFHELIDHLLFHDEWETLKRNQTYLHEFKGPGKNNKIKFKLMDIEDIIRKNEQ